MTRFLVNGKDLKDIGVTQNEVGRYYYNGKSYYKPLLADFDNAIPPKGYTTYTNGSHSSTNYNGINVRKQKAIDFSTLGVGVADREVEVVKGSATLGKQSYVIIKTLEGFYHYFLHQKPLTKIGKFPAGTPLFREASDHIHLFAYRNTTGDTYVRDLILDTNTEMIKVGDKVEFITKDGIANTMLRKGNGICFDATATIPTGAVARIKAGSRPDHKTCPQKGYTWWDCEFLDGTGWAVDLRMKVTNKPVTKSDGTVPEPPKPPVDPAVEKVKSGNFELVTKFEGYKPVSNRIQ